MGAQWDLVLPKRTKIYDHHHLDSTFWAHFTPRDHDVVIATCYKSGTTWIQQIVTELMWQGKKKPLPLHALIPWVDCRFIPREQRLQMVEGLPFRRVLKTHAPLDGVEFDPKTKYIMVGRKGLDVVMSLWNHYGQITGEHLMVFNDGLDENKLPHPPKEFKDFYEQWVTRGWFDWESSGYPYWDYVHYMATWWPVHDLPNVKFIHFNDLLEDLPGMMRDIAKFLDVPIVEDTFDETVRRCTFDYMKEHAEELAPPMIDKVLERGVQGFFFKGTNDRWAGELSEEQIQQYEDLIQAKLSPDCIKWLERRC